ncbi:MAG TPA: polysaccharide deacetylase family protein [Flavitalea sp.]|nr:polysaccharide deacetylase family protein [Flavitalea sp.]
MSLITNIKKIFRPARAVVLMYHRIADISIDPWQLAVTTENFKAHIRVLADTGKVISTDQLIEYVMRRKFDYDCFCITSDDGYQDNFYNALPILQEYNCPFTIFIPSGSINAGEPFWWDMLTDIFLLNRKLPATLNINISNKKFTYILENDGEINDEQIKKHSSWHWPLPPPTQRCKIYLEIWMHLRDLPAMVIQDALRKLKSWCCIEGTNEYGNLPMSREELISMSSGTNVHIGNHTVTHAALGAFPKDIQKTEISGCREYLNDILGKNHYSIAFPYGNYNSDTLDIVRKMGLKGAFITDPKPVTATSDVYQLGRFQVINQTGDQFKKQLQQWLNN